MPIEFRCPSCSRRFQTPDQAAGKRAKCPACGAFADASTTPASTSPTLATAGGFLIGLSLLAYVSSFCLPAFVTNGPSEQTIWGISAFIMGFLGLLQLQTTWLANPALWVGLICAACRAWKAATVFGILATCFALAALLIYEPRAAPVQYHCTSFSGCEKMRLTLLLPGYCCWLASMVVFLSGSTLKLLSSRGRRPQQRGAAQGVTRPPQARSAGRSSRERRRGRRRH